MQRYGLQPRINENREPDTNTLRVMVPGLNTPEPETSRRTALYANVQGQAMMHLHNYLDIQLPATDQLDYASAALTRLGVQETELMRQLETLLQSATLDANEVRTTEELYDKARRGEKILVPEGVKGDVSELWDPANAPR